ncbi:putative inactive serine/threonine-protein kinase scy1 [Monoraphidium neglectum]|uniref:Putative inactive serine/threonine-protein kinase scy1 n=1 Tax=Monoraphidium neglectum TaxID=145388 RepID=A0A0D2JLZ4_9CHLO|nr:putative inactive serine/threonine-protein kinase scy1 [Monoraphidium neglectum]KIZ00223.1 putative inactive serine/threonine-protein kinase scy1 [Monoraphidium neglectum]|eukprot:XP_013899242.1 putative inactive serine/threonine-protein kinase scy1 [Monoraphidium neglectum]
MSAVAVTDTLDWKLHGFDLLSEAACQGDFALQHAAWMVGPHYKAAEVAKADWAAVAQGPPWAVDSWGLGCMMQEVFSGEPLRAVEQLRRTEVIPPALLGDYQKLLNSNPARRLNPSQAGGLPMGLSGPYGGWPLRHAACVKDGAEKDAFFKRLPTLLPAVPEAVAARKVLPLLSRALEFGGAPPSAVGSLLQIGRPLPQDEFQKRVVPSLAKLFASTDRSLRRNLLESVDVWGPHLTTPIVEEQIFPHLQTGFNDDNAYIRELTLKATLAIAPKLKQATLTAAVYAGPA